MSEFPYDVTDPAPEGGLALVEIHHGLDCDDPDVHALDAQGRDMGRDGLEFAMAIDRDNVEAVIKPGCARVVVRIP